jgi:prophage regulatory protein
MRSTAVPRHESSPPPGEAANFLRMPSVIRQTGLGRSTIYRLMSEQRFPKAVRLSGRAIGWRATDVQKWAESRIEAGA